MPKMPLPESYLIAVTTVAAETDAERLASALVERRLAACVQIVGPISSVYRWQGKLEKASEWQLWIKTRADLWTELERTVGELHPYQTPELLALPIVHGAERYLRWMDESLGKTPAD